MSFRRTWQLYFLDKFKYIQACQFFLAEPDICFFWTSNSKREIQNCLAGQYNFWQSQPQAAVLLPVRVDLKWLIRSEYCISLVGYISMNYRQNPNDLRLMVRETTSSRPRPGASSSGGGGGPPGANRPPRQPQDAVEEQYYDSDTVGVLIVIWYVLSSFVQCTYIFC